MVKAILFDFDGVIMDSMGLKLDTYCFALQQFDFPYADIKDLVHTLAGLSRQKTLALMYEALSGKKITERTAMDLVSRFTEHDENSRALMLPMPGTLPFLEKVHAQVYTAIVTGTPQAVIDKTVTYHRLDTYFDEVRGSPQSKVDIVEDLISRQDIPRDQWIFIGDGKTDQDAADVCQIRFVGLDQGTVSFTHSRAWKVVSTLIDLLPLFDSLCDDLAD